MELAQKAVPIDPTAHPGAMIALMLTPEQQLAVTDGVPGRLAREADHCTLLVLADDATTLLDAKPALVASLASLAAACQPIAAWVNGYGVFAGDDDGYPLVLLLDSPSLPDLRHALSLAAAASGIAPDMTHGFTPHVTLAYLPNDTPTPRMERQTTPLSFDALSLVWGGERIDLPFLGRALEQTLDADDAIEDAKALTSETAAATIAEQHETPTDEATEIPTDAPANCPACGAAMADGACTCGYVAAKAIAYGGAVKALPDDPYRLRTRGIVWGGRDLEGDQFVRGETDLGASRSFVGMPVYWDHADFKDTNPVKSQIGTVVYADEDDKGITFEIELDRSKRYVEDIKALERAGALGSSTGAIDYLIKRRQGKLKRWVVGEISLTPEPMEPRTHAALAAKSFDGAPVAPPASPPPSPQEDTAMGDTLPTIPEAQPGADIAQLTAEVKTLGATVQSVRSDLDDIRSLPAVKSAQDLGGSIGGGLNAQATEDPQPRSYHNFKALAMVSYPGKPTRQIEYPEGVFGGFVKAVFNAHKTNPSIVRDAIKALDETYGSSSDSDGAKALGTQAGVSGAYLVPEQFLPNLMQIARQSDVLYGRTMVIPADGGEIVIPALDHSGSFSAGQSNYYGGVTVTWSNDDATTTDTTPSFKQVRLKTNALKASTRVANQLMMRSAIAIDAVVGQLLGAAIGRARDYALIQGTGVGQPQGFLNAACTIDQGGSAIDFATLAGMEDNVIPERDDNYVWLIHSKKRSSIWALQQTNNTLVTLLPNLRDRPTTTLLGRPVAFTDKTPYTSGDVSNTVNLIDPSMMVVAEFQGIALAVSDQARFEQDQTVIRAILSIDAQPWLTSKIAVTSTPDYVSGFITI